MTKLTELPFELLTNITAHLDRQSLKQLRCTCRQFHESTTPRIFQTLHFFPNDKSNRKFNHILKDERVRDFVQEIYLNTCEKDSPDFYRPTNEVDRHDPDEPSFNTKEQALSLNQFPCLRRAVVRFDRRLDLVNYGLWHYPQSLKFRLRVLKWFFTLWSSPVRPGSLAIRNMHCVCPDTELSAMLTEVLQGLRALRLNIVNPEITHFACYMVHKPHLIEELPSTWLKPTMSTLEHLTLYNDQPFGFYPKLDLTGIHFPNLQSLALGNFSFCHDVQVDWILSHGSTLRELYLDACTILYAISPNEDHVDFYHPAVRSGKWELVYLQHIIKSVPVHRYSGRWHDYFTLFRERLLRLRHFRIGRSVSPTILKDWKIPEYPFEKEQEIRMGLFQDRYMIFYGRFRTVDSSGIPDLGGVPNCHGADKNALYALLRKIGQNVGELYWDKNDLVE